MSGRVCGQARRKRVEAIAERDGWECWYCGVGLDAGSPSTTLDEWVPIARGGRPLIDNQVLACSPCNQDKADMTGHEYLGKLAGSVPASYQEWRVESKRKQQYGWPASWKVTPVHRPLRRPSNLSVPLAEIWPA